MSVSNMLCSNMVLCGCYGVLVVARVLLCNLYKKTQLDIKVLTCCCVVAMFLVLWLKGCYCATVCNCMATCNTYNLDFECVLTCCCVVAMFLVLCWKGVTVQQYATAWATCNTYNIRFWVCSKHFALWLLWLVWVVPRVLLVQIV